MMSIFKTYNSNSSRMSILKPLALQKALDQANTGGVYASLLLNHSGSPIAQAILENEQPTASIAGHIWKVKSLAIFKLSNIFSKSTVGNRYVELFGMLKY